MTRGDHNRLHNAARTRCPDTGRLLPAGRLLDGLIWDQMPAPTAKGEGV
jgi:hypothetical protein